MERKLKATIKTLIYQLEKVTNVNDINCVMGLDGFVDQILHVVKTRTDANNYERMNTISEFGEFINRAAGLSSNIEFIPKQIKLGGNGPIMSAALSNYGLNMTYIGALGVPDINPVFKHMEERCNVISIANPGLSDAVEFLDGKVIIGKRECLKDINWCNLKEKVSVKNLIELFENSKLVGLENWTMLPYMTEIWKGLLAEVVPYISDKERFIFFDLADPENRLKKDIIEALNLLKEFSTKFKVILGLNEKESNEIADVLEIKQDNISLEERTVEIAKKLNIYCLVIHPVKEAVCYCNNNYYHTYGPYEPNPKLTTGAGDNFNAGFCLGQVLDLQPQLSILLGTATSGYYVRNAKSPTLKEVIEFLKEWEGNETED